MIVSMVATAHFLHLKSQELHEALMSAHETIGEAVEEKVYLRRQFPAADTSKHQEALAAAASIKKRTKLAEFDTDELRGQLGLA